MSGIDDAINSLSADELDVLNSDPQMLADFKAKYSSAPSAGPANWKDYAMGMAKKQMEGTTGPVSKGWAALKFAKPVGQVLENTKSALVGKTLNDIVGEPSGDVVNDAIKNTPRIAQETVGEVAPNMYLSRPALATAGALGLAKVAAPAAQFVGKKAADIAEAATGLGFKTPGVLTEAFKNPGLIFSKGLDAARAMYRTAKGGVEDIPEVLQGPIPKGSFIEKAYELAKKGELTGDAALEARKAVRDSPKDFTDSTRKMLIDLFDSTAKEKFGGADSAYQTAVKAEALRTPYALNKGGSPSLGRLGLAEWLLPKRWMGAVATAPLTSGAIATTAGAGAKLAAPLVNSPVIGMPIPTIVEKIKELMARRRQ